MDNLILMMAKAMAVPMAVAFLVGFLAALIGQSIGRVLGNWLEQILFTPCCETCMHQDRCNNTSYNLVCSAYHRKLGAK